MSKTAIVPVAMLADALLSVQNVAHDAYSRGSQVCCGKALLECCGSPVMQWGADDAAVMDGLRPAQQKLAEMLFSSPPVPDEVIEEAAKAIYAALCGTETPVSDKVWNSLSNEERDILRNMARAAARVFNGKVCSSFCAAGEPCSISEDGRCFLGGCNG